MPSPRLCCLAVVAMIVAGPAGAQIGKPPSSSKKAGPAAAILDGTG